MWYRLALSMVAVLVACAPYRGTDIDTDIGEDCYAVVVVENKLLAAIDVYVEPQHIRVASHIKPYGSEAVCVRHTDMDFRRGLTMSVNVSGMRESYSTETIYDVREHSVWHAAVERGTSPVVMWSQRPHGL